MSSTRSVTRSESTSSTLARVPFTRLSTISTWSPRAASCRTSSDPMKPAPPVTSTVERLLIYRLRLLVSRTPSPESGWYAGDDRKRRHVARHHRAGADDRALADRHTRQDDGVDTDVGPRADSHRLYRQVRLDDRHVSRHAGVHGPEHFGSRSPAHVFLDHQVARIEVALRSNPDMIADDAATVEAALQNRLIAKKDTRADLERLRMAAQDTPADLHAVAKAADNRPPGRAAHHGVEFRFAVGKAAVQLEERPRFIPRTHGVRELTFKRRIRHHRTPAVLRF